MKPCLKCKHHKIKTDTDYGMNNKWVECPIKKKRFTAVGEMPDKCKLFAGG